MDTWEIVLASPNFSDYLRNVFDFGRQAILTVVAGIENLQYKDARLRGEYPQCLSDLQRLRNKVIEYIDRAEAHPICSEERRKAILDELQDTDKEGRLDVNNTRRFPRTIDFVSELTNWLDTMANKYREVKQCIGTFDRKTRAAWIRAQDLENYARRRKKISVGAVGSSAIGRLYSVEWTSEMEYWNSGMPYFILSLNKAYAYHEAAQAVSVISESQERGVKAIQSVGPSE